MHVKRYVRCPVQNWEIPESLLSEKWFTKKKKPALVLLVELKEFG
jgi:hypothetical protein